MVVKLESEEENERAAMITMHPKFKTLSFANTFVVKDETFWNETRERGRENESNNDNDIESCM